MRSGREHNTPDKALWGFLVTVKAQVRKRRLSSNHTPVGAFKSIKLLIFNSFRLFL